MGHRSAVLLAGALLTALGCAAPQMAAPRPAPFDHTALDSLTPSERAALSSGGRAARPLEFEKGGGRYVGGVSYQVVRAEPHEVLGALRDPERLALLLPRTERVVDVRGGDGLRRLELHQGNDFVSARYTVVVEEPAAGEMRFWLDRDRPRDIEDVWGYFRVRRFGNDQSLITVAVALDVGPGIVRMLFEDKIQEMILATPTHMRDVFARGLAAHDVNDSDHLALRR